MGTDGSQSKQRRTAAKKAASSVKQSKTPKSRTSNQPVKPRRERPDVLPPRKSTGALPAPTQRSTRGERWAMLADNPRQDLEMDAGWGRVRLGTSQGTGKRR